MMKVMGLILAISIFTLFTGSVLWAGGLYLNEFGTPAMGNAGAGAGAEANDASTAFHNPAGMTRLFQPELMVTGGLGYGSVSFDSDGSTGISGGNGGNAGGLIPLLGLHYVHPLNEDWRFGCSIISISGAALDYNRDWTGRYQNTEVSLLTTTLNPTLAYRVNDWLSVAAGPAIMYGQLEMKASVDIPGPNDGRATLDGDDWDVGFTLSTLMEMNEQTRFGLTYLSELELKLRGDLKVNPVGVNIRSDTTIPLAQMIRGSVYHDLDEEWTLVGTLGWEDWSNMDNIPISTGAGSGAIPRHWHDTWHYSAGVHYRPDEQWTFRTGVTYDTSPVSAKHRTADMPIDRQLRFAVGADYDWSETLAVGGSVVYADLGNARIRSATLNGDYDKNGYIMFGLYSNWKF
jgi:long-chain fatty acid transport protein